jgi:predicted outer membrane repeat protein
MKGKQTIKLLLVLFTLWGELAVGVFQPLPLPAGHTSGKQSLLSTEPNLSIYRGFSPPPWSRKNASASEKGGRSGSTQSINQLWQDRASYRRYTGNQGSCVPNEIIVKYKPQAAYAAANAQASSSKTAMQAPPTALSMLNQKYKARNITPLAKDSKAKQAPITQPLAKGQAGLTTQERRLLRRLQRADMNVKAPVIESIYKLTVEPEAGESLADVAAAYNACSEVEYAELNYIVSISGSSDDPLFDQQWALHNTGQNYLFQSAGTIDCDIDAPEAWDLSTGSRDIVVAVIDTGVDYKHRDLLGNMWADAKGHFGYDFANDDADPNDDNGHGTHCAGTIGAKGNNGLDIAGICWDVKIMAVKFLNADGQGSTDNAIKAILYAVEQGADVLSNSWGGEDYSSALQDAINYAHSQGVMIVAAAGNEGNTIPQYPANYDHVLSVAATDSNDQKASFSTYGQWVDIAAPGVDILSLRAGGTALGTVYDGYTTVLSGTSMACPHVAGACALLLSRDPTLGDKEVYDILMETVDPIKSEYPISLSGGRLNLANALSRTAPSKGRVYFDKEYYPCSGPIGIRLADLDLAGSLSTDVTITTGGGDMETVTLYETNEGVGVFTGTVLFASAQIYPHDGIVQGSHNESITVSYEDANDGSGSAVQARDTAVVDCMGPQISTLQINGPGSVVTVDFATDEKATAVVRAGLSCGGNYPIVINSPLSATHHTVSLKGLQPETNYFFVIELTDSLGNKTVDDHNGTCFQFTTSAAMGNIYVPRDFNSIQDAIGRAWDGDTIWVADGTYAGPGNYDIDFLGLAITVRSEHGPERCIIDCRMNGRGFFFHNQETSASVLDGFTIKNGYPAADVSPKINFDAWLGGGIYCTDSGPTITNCKVTDNFAPYWGGGICIINRSTAQPVRIHNCIVSRNRASLWGGGIYSEGRILLTQSALNGNTAGAGGGGINCSGQILLDGCTIEGNRIYKQVVDSGYGGGVFAVGDFKMINSVIRENEGYYGGGLFYFDDQAVISNCIFNGNRASYGGGISYYGSELILTNCTLAENSAAYSGGAIGYYESGFQNNTVIENCILWNNQAASDGNEIAFQAPDSLLTIAYSDMEGGDSGVFMSNTAALDWHNSNMSVDPNFALAHDYHLTKLSPCINRGTNNPVNGLAEKDIEGNQRLIDGIADMGACEFGNQAAVIAVSPGAFQFQCAESGSKPAAQSLFVRNCGGGLLSWRIDVDCPWLEVSSSSGTSAGEINRTELSINSTQLTAGQYECLLTVYDSAAASSPRTIPISLHVSGTFRVPSQYLTIRSAIDAAWNGDIVLVADGTYTGNGNRDIEFYGKAITVKSEQGPDSCIIDCRGTDTSPHRGFAFSELSNSIIDGFTIKGGYVNGDYYAIFPPSQGGGVYSWNSYPVIQNCKIMNNFCSSGLLPGCGGGIMLEGASSLRSVPIRNCIIQNNHTDSTGGGLGATVPFLSENSLFTQNSSSLAGGGIYHLPYYPYGEITHSLVTKNTSKLGGGIYIDGGSGEDGVAEDLVVTNTILRNNTATQGSQIAMASLFIDSFARAGVSHSDINAGPNNIYIGDGFRFTWGAGNIDRDPLFVNSANNDYRLRPESPAIDAGQAFTAGRLENESPDFTGQFRPIDGNYDGLAVSDMGPYEFLPEPSLSPVIALSAWEYNFIAYQNEINPAGQILRLWNSGAGTLNWTIQNDCDWIHAVPMSGSSSGEIQDVTLYADTTGLVRGRYQCELAILDNTAVNSPRTFKVNLRIFVRGQHYVPSEFMTLQAAINASSDGDVIIVSPGTYTENINIQGKNITLTSADPNDPAVVAGTIIHGNDANPVITLKGYETACGIAGFTITGGRSPGHGGGIQGNQARASIQNCTLRGNTAQGQGGGVDGIRGPVSNCIIEENTSVLGGGIADCNEVFNSVISRNQSQEGGGLYNINGNITRCTIVSNTALKGGGLSQCTGRLENCSVVGNTAQEQGGGVFGVGGSIVNCVIEENQSVLGGGAAECRDVFNSVISRNQSQEGGGLYNINGNIAHCTIAANTALRGAGLSQCQGRIENCIVWGNTTDALYQSSRPYFSCIEGDGRGEGNLDLDPGFVNFESRDYRLAPGSFCIDAGNPSPAIFLQADIDGNPRLLDGNNDGTVLSDMGAYEMPVSDQPVIGISADQLTFSSLSPGKQTFRIWNAGLPPIHYTIQSQNCQWLSVDPASGIVSEGVSQEISLTVDAKDIPGGIYECQLVVSDPRAVNNPRIITVQLKIFKNEIYLTPQDSTIQHAINYLMDGGTLILADGVYAGPGNQDIDFGGIAATLKSEHGPEHCIIDPNGSETTPHRAFIFRNHEDANSILDGLTIINGCSRQPGGAIYCELSSPTITNCIFRNNRAEGAFGGAIYSEAGASRITNCVFQSNSARFGGGVAVLSGTCWLMDNIFLSNSATLGGALYARSEILNARGCVFTENTASDGGGIYSQASDGELTSCIFTENFTTLKNWNHGGGALYNLNSYLKLSECRFLENRGGWDGGAILNSQSSPSIQGCEFIGNQSLGNDGGAIFNVTRSDPNIIRCTFRSNYAKSWGGAMRNQQSSPRMENCLFAANSAIDNGGAIFNYFKSEPTIKNCTFTENSANGHDGDSLYSLDNCWTTVVNTIFWEQGPSAVFDDKSQTDISYSNIAWPGAGNIDLPPRFRDSQNGDFHLDRHSPCIDAGKDIGLYADLDGNPRPWDFPMVDNNQDEPEIDMGAYEFVNQKPIARPGDSQIAYAWIDRYAQVVLDASKSSDDDSPVLGYTWKWQDPQGRIVYFNGADGVINLQDLAALSGHWLDTGQSYMDMNPNETASRGKIDEYDLSLLAESWLSSAGSPEWNWVCDIAPSTPVVTIGLSVGEHQFELVVNDTIEYSEPNQIHVTVIEPVEVPLLIIPPVLRSHAQAEELIAVLHLPRSIRAEQVDWGYSLVMIPGQLSAKQAMPVTVGNQVFLLGIFDRDAMLQFAGSQKQLPIQVVGRLKSGPYIFGQKKVTVLTVEP